MTDMEQILERLASLERSVKTLTEMVSAMQSHTGKVEYAVRETSIEIAAPPMTEARPTIIDTDHPLIIRIPTRHRGEPMTRHSRISVRILIGWMKLGETAEQIRKDYEPHLSIAEICDSLSYYFHHQAEIDGLLAADEAAHALELSRIAERKQAALKNE